MLGLILVALSLGASNFAASIAIGLGGVDNRTRLRVGLIFGLFEAGMPLIGLAIGRLASDRLGAGGHYVGATLLVAVGIYTIAARTRTRAHTPPNAHGSGRLLLTGLALSLDNVVVGLALSSFHVPFLVAGVVIAAVSVGMSLVGLEIGGRVGVRLESRSEITAGMVLVAVGVGLATGALG